MLQVKSKLDKKDGLSNRFSFFFQCNQNHFNELFIWLFVFFFKHFWSKLVFVLRFGNKV